MNGETHNFYAVITGSILISIISGINCAFGRSVWIGIITNIIALIIYGSSSLIDNVYKKKQKEEKEAKTKSKFVEDTVSIGKKIGMLILYLNVIVVCAVSCFNYEYWFGANITIAMLSMLLVIAGAVTPDLDTMLFGINVHRNPLSHSWVIPIILWTFGMISYGVGNETFVYIGMYCIGYASHLILDTIPSTAGFFEGIKEIFTFSHAPGDIRIIPERWEHAWLFFGGMGLFAGFLTSIARYYGIVGFDYDVEGDWNVSTISIVIIGASAVLLWFVLMFYGKVSENKKPSKRSKVGYSKRYNLITNTTTDADKKKSKKDDVVETIINDETVLNDDVVVKQKTVTTTKKRKSTKKPE